MLLKAAGKRLADRMFQMRDDSDTQVAGPPVRPYADGPSSHERRRVSINALAGEPFVLRARRAAHKILSQKIVDNLLKYPVFSLVDLTIYQDAARKRKMYCFKG